MRAMWQSRRIALRAAKLVLCGVLLVSAGCSARRSQQYTQQGETYLLLGNLEAAEGAFNRATDLDPQNAQARLGLGRVLWLRKDAANALVRYNEALALDPKLEKAYLEATRIHLTTNDVAGAEAMAAKYEGVDPEAGGILHAYVYRETGRAQEAVSLLTGLRERAPKSANLRVNLAASYLAAGQADKAEAEANSVLSELDAASLPARMLLVDAYQQQGKTGQIVEEMRALAAEKPADENLQLALARSLFANGQLEEAEKIVRPILDRTPESPWANFVLGACLVQKEQFAEAEACLAAAFGALPHHPEVARMLTLARQGGKGASQEGAQTPAPGAAAAETARVEQSWRGLWENASLRTLLSRRESFGPETATADLQEVLALSALFTQDLDLAKKLAEALPETSPVRAYVNALAARDGEEVKKVLDGWTETTRDRQVLRANALGFAQALGGARAQALDTLSRAIADNPDNGVAYYNLASMYRSAGMPRFAAGALQKLITRHSANSEARQLLYDSLTEAGMMLEARQLAESTYAVFPEDPFAAIMLARAYRDAGEIDLATDVLKQGVVRAPNAAILSVALAEIQLYAEQLDAAKATLDALQASQQLPQQTALLTAFHAAATDAWGEVESICHANAGAFYPLSFRLLHVAALLKSGKEAEASSPLLSADGTPIVSPSTNVLLKVLGKPEVELAPDDAALADVLANRTQEQAAFAYGMACREARFTQRAFALFDALNAQMPAKPRVLAYALSSLARAGGMPERDVKARKYTEEYPALAAAWIGLSEVLHALKDMDGELAALKKAVEVAPESVEAWLRYAQYLDQTSDLPAQLEANRRLAALLPGDPFIANNLAYCILQTNGDASEALALAKAASEKAPRNPEIIHTLGLAQFRAGDLEEGARNLSMALELRPGDPTLLLDAGNVLIAQGKAEQGRAYVQYAIQYADQLGLEFPRRAEAEQIMAQG
ncbi:MAG: tetratricopeptide repeat protein [Candidatus Hydrogenedentes bacterium]|nr:tetratricopeptide repeat protein [Candidatus Hydrogenedentota bacterium]